MDIVKFLDNTWQEIPEQDNPAMNNDECIMIFKGTRDAYRISHGGFVVVRVPKEGDIIKLGVFWKIENAEIFADIMAEHGSPELFEGTHDALNKLSI